MTYPRALVERLGSLGERPSRWPPFKEGSHLTCPHGRFWASCQRCRTPRLRPDAAERNVAVCGESRQRLTGGSPS